MLDGAPPDPGHLVRAEHRRLVLPVDLDAMLVLEPERAQHAVPAAGGHRDRGHLAGLIPANGAPRLNSPRLEVEGDVRLSGEAAEILRVAPAEQEGPGDVAVVQRRPVRVAPAGQVP